MKFVTYYKILCTETGKCYIGKTTQTLAKRMSSHRANYKQYMKKKPNCYKCSSYDIIERDNYMVIQLLRVDATNMPMSEVKQLERKFVEDHLKTGFCVNKNIPNRSRKEYLMLRKEWTKEYMKRKYRETDSRYRKYKKEYYQKKKESAPKVHCKHCNKYVPQYNMKQHERAKKHIKAVEKYKNGLDV